jgi:AsmA family/AsmA-like C-terminal region
VKMIGTKRRVAALLAILLVAGLCLIRPGANRLRARIVSSISSAVGRPVEVASVNLRVLPQPGFDLEGFVMRDDPEFSAEPLIRAQEVTAVLRVIPLLRGKIEISRLNLSDPSLNLVRNDAGHWNLEELLQRTSEIAVAPTSKAKSEPRPGFPYIEASGARINFKFHHEKLPYALTDADFALWQDSENAWGMRMEAQPVRTDFNLTDTGTVKVSGSWQRAASLRDTPLKFTAQWNRAQLGQLTKLVYGDDKGWRGAILLTATLSGTPADLKVATQASLQDFRRYDIVAGGPLLLSAHCDGHYSSIDRLLSQIDCHAPVNDGEIALKGNVTGLYHPSSYDLSLSAHDVPLQGLVGLLRHTKGDIPKDLIAVGKINGSVNVMSINRMSAVWKGEGETTGLHLASKSTKADLSLERIRFAVSRPDARHVAFVDIGPLAVAMGRPTPVSVSARLSRTGYNVQVQGDAQVRRLLQSAETIGLPVPKFSADGPAKVDFQIAGEWRGFAAPKITGKAQLHGVRADLNELSEPLEIASATVSLSAEQTRVSNLNASLAGSTWKGSLDIPRPCTREGKCSAHFNLAADEIDTTQLREAVVGNAHNRVWYRFLAGKTALTFLTTLHASGKLSAGTLNIRNLSATRVSTEVTLEDGTLHLSNLQGELMGSTHHGDWTIDFSKQPAVYTGNGTLDEVDLEQLSSAMHDPWVTGTAGASYEVKASGNTVADLLESATGTLTVEAREGTLPHLTLTRDPLEFERFAGKFILSDGELDITDGKLQCTEATYQVAGSASMSNELNLRLVRNTGRGFNVTGSLTDPIVQPALFPETRAALKP